MPGSVVKHDPLVRWSECRAHRNKLISCLIVSIVFHLKMGFLKQLITMIQSLDETISGVSLKPFYCFEILLSSSKMILMNPDESFSLILFHQTCHVCFLSELALTDSWIINSFDVIGQAALQKVWNCLRFSLIYSDSWLTQWIFAAVSHI